MKESSTKNSKTILEGIALALSFVVTSLFLYLVPEFIGNQIFTRSIGVFLGILGLLIILSSISINMKNVKLNEGLKDIGVAIFLGVILFPIHYFFSHWFVNLIIVFFIVVMLYGFFRGMIVIIIESRTGNKINFGKLSFIILNIAIFVLTIMQLIEIFGFKIAD
nr:hypothetical protein [Jeotgalibacillus malaysiensis]